MNRFDPASGVFSRYRHDPGDEPRPAGSLDDAFNFPAGARAHAILAVVEEGIAERAF